MYQKDYILRMIEEIGRFLAGLKMKKNDEEGFNDFLEFISAHFGIELEDLNIENLSSLEEKLKSAMADYPDELGQLLLNGGEVASVAGRRDVTEVLYLLAWTSFMKAENESGTYRFERVVEMNGLKEKLGLMGINV
jgi:hypothetical protein